jgi:hypothetical protein
MAEVDYKKPALVGGLIVGLLSVTPLVGYCCCLWAVAGGIVAAKMLVSRSPQPLRSSEGARVGLFAGIIGGAIYFLVIVPVAYWQMDRSLESLSSLPPFMSEEGRAIIERMQQNPRIIYFWLIPITLMAAIFLMGFTVLGGVLGVALFEKRSSQPPPAPYPGPYPPGYPPNYPEAAPPTTPPTTPPTAPSGDPPPSGGRAGGQGGEEGG